MNENEIIIKGARVHNLKNIDVRIPRDRLVVITGLSGSGKSSLAFDTLYAEGQRRYVESLSAYARQFLGRIDKPDVDSIHGIPPAVALEQRVNTRNPRSTVGTSTEIYDYLKLLYARIGKTYSPVSGKLVRKHSVADVVDYILSSREGTRLVILARISLLKEKEPGYQLDLFIQQGMTRAVLDDRIWLLEELKTSKALSEKRVVSLVVDRIVVQNDSDSVSRFGDSVQTAFQIGHGHCMVWNPDTGHMEEFSTRFEADGMTFEEPNEHLFSFNNPVGACPVCEGYGKIMGIDEDLVIPDKTLSVYEDAIICWKGEKMKKWKERLILHADQFNFPIHTPYYRLSDEQRQLLWTGNRHFHGLNRFFEYLEEKKYKIQYRVMLSRYRGKTTCPQCNGTRLRKESGYVKIAGKTISDLVLMPVDELNNFMSGLKLPKSDQKIAERLLKEIHGRLRYLTEVGLGYLTLNRLSATLSGGESQRINLATSLGSSLVGSLYILDEPSVGLHSRDTYRLISVLRELREIGNSVIVVEHDEDIIRAADVVIDIGPGAGRLGGEIVFMGNHEALQKEKKSQTARFLNGTDTIDIPSERRKWSNYIEITGARENNLKKLNVRFPLNTLTVVTGVSGSGKSSLVSRILYPALQRHLTGSGEKPGKFDLLRGDLHLLDRVEFVDQNPIGKSSRSNPVTYLKAYDEIRKLYADQPASKINGFTASHFSFNVEGGRCEECQGEGEITVEMQFMADIHLTCESCHGKRFKDEILQVLYRGRSIYDMLEMTINEAIEFFSTEHGSTEQRIVKKLMPLRQVGLGYVKLGQSSSTLSGGESQRVKLAFFLSKESGEEHVLFIFDEPTTGLHFHDISLLLNAFDSLIRKGHSIIVIEHNMEVIKSADWIIDLGPEGGAEGGYLMNIGTPETVKNAESPTGIFLRKKIG
ncbi:MAG: excinuclease ABC subunit UvrA [Bacteroidales bacterium]|nr:excinuclease ABC subunit UvrA [Bacteroidales bacterium]MBN2697275.1 excinuclease ABC subunit UvrA [Bacteroidales bacterium]